MHKALQAIIGFILFGLPTRRPTNWKDPSHIDIQWSSSRGPMATSSLDARNLGGWKVKNGRFDFTLKNLTC